MYIDEGKTMNECVEHFGCSSKTLYNNIRKQGLSKNPKIPGRQKTYNLDGLKAMYEKCKDVNLCAKHYQCSVSTIRFSLNRMGAEFTRQRRNIDNDALIKMYNSGKTIQECAEEFKCAVSTVRIRLIKLDVYMHQVGENRLKGLKAMFEETKSIRKCADHYRCSIFEMHRRLKELGLD